MMYNAPMKFACKLIHGSQYTLAIGVCKCLYACMLEATDQLIKKYCEITVQGCLNLVRHYAIIHESF